MLARCVGDFVATRYRRRVGSGASSRRSEELADDGGEVTCEGVEARGLTEAGVAARGNRTPQVVVAQRDNGVGERLGVAGWAHPHLVAGAQQLAHRGGVAGEDGALARRARRRPCSG